MEETLLRSVHARQGDSLDANNLVSSLRAEVGECFMTDKDILEALRNFEKEDLISKIFLAKYGREEIIIYIARSNSENLKLKVKYTDRTSIIFDSLKKLNPNSNISLNIITESGKIDPNKRFGYYGFPDGCLINLPGFN